MAHHLDISLRLPPGLAFTQWKDGSIHIQYTIEDVVKLRDTLVETAQRLNQQAVEHIEAKKALEIERQRLPVSNMQKLDTQLSDLKNEGASIPKVIMPISEIPLPPLSVAEIISAAK